jgi:tetratricopeptide (TPR) repeat protein
MICLRSNFRRRRVASLALSAFCIVCSLIFAVPPSFGDSQWDTANKAYRDGKFEEAKVDYLRSVRAGQYSANLFYNLGNAWFKLGDHGRAILNYERALLLDPGLDEAKANLRSVLKLGGTDIRPTFRDVVSDYADVFARVASIAFWISAFALVAAFGRHARLARLGLVVCIVAAFIFLGSASTLLWIGVGPKDPDLAVVITPSAELKYGPAVSGRSVETLQIGDHVQVISERGDWTFCRASSGSLGWILTQKAERIIPSSGS